MFICFLRRIPTFKSVVRSMSYLSPLSPDCTVSDDLLQYSSGALPVSPNELNLKQTLLGGQSFRWTEHIADEFIGVLRYYIIRLKQENNQLHYIFYTNTDLLPTTDEKDRQSESSRLLHDYFQLSIKVNDLFEKWSLCDKRFQRGQIPIGIRVLAQEPLENVLSFICSSNNNVQRISKMVRQLSDVFGRKLGTVNGINYHQFPTIDELDQPDLEKHLRGLQFGYRARYIQKAIQYLKYSVNDPSYFDRLKALPVKEARQQLLKIMGVGRKVADCILLMSLGKQNVVPVDTHIHSMAVTHYGQGKKLQLTAANYEEITSFFEDLWQPLAGWAQSAAFSNELRGPKPGKRGLESSDECSSVSRKKRNRASK